MFACQVSQTDELVSELQLSSAYLISHTLLLVVNSSVSVLMSRVDTLIYSYIHILTVNMPSRQSHQLCVCVCVCCSTCFDFIFCTSTYRYLLQLQMHEHFICAMEFYILSYLLTGTCHAVNSLGHHTPASTIALPFSTLISSMIPACC